MGRSGRQLPALEQFFGGYFNQDWDLDAPDDGAVVALFVREAAPERLDEVRRELDRLLALRLDEKQLRDVLLSDLAAYYDPGPDGLTMTEWLRRVRSLLES
jgi:CdiI immunity protein